MTVNRALSIVGALVFATCFLPPIARAEEPCRSAADCKAGRVCRAARCVQPECTQDEQCRGGYCDAAGACQGGVRKPAAVAPPGRPGGSVAPAAGEATDTVFLNGGGRVRGVISVDDPNAGVTIVLADGTVTRIEARRVKRTVYGGGIAAARPAPAAPEIAPVAPDPAPAWAPPPPDRRPGRRWEPRASTPPTQPRRPRRHRPQR